MGVLVSDTVAVPNLGVSVAGFSISCRGGYEVSKLEENVYVVRSRLYWVANGASQPIYVESFTFLLDHETLGSISNMFVELYSRVKERYQNTTDI